MLSFMVCLEDTASFGEIASEDGAIGNLVE
jgi:hypothetical protein